MLIVTLIATLRQPRSNPNETKTFSVGPFFAAGNVRQLGTVKPLRPANAARSSCPATELRRIESASLTDESPVAVFRFNSVPVAAKPLLEFDVRTASGFVVARCRGTKLTLTPLGWKLVSDFCIAPVRMAVENVAVELPAGWQNPTFSPLDLVEEVQGSSDATAPRTG